MKRMLLIWGVAALLALPAAAGDSKAMGCCGKQAGVERSVASIDNGVRVTMTSADAKVAAMLQEKAPSCANSGCGDCPMHSEGVTRTVEKTDNGVVITATAADPALVAKLQKHAAAGAASCAKAEGKAGCCAKSGEAARGCAHGSKAAPATT